MANRRPETISPKDVEDFDSTLLHRGTSGSGPNVAALQANTHARNEQALQDARLLMGPLPGARGAATQPQSVSRSGESENDGEKGDAEEEGENDDNDEEEEDDDDDDDDSNQDESTSSEGDFFTHKTDAIPQVVQDVVNAIKAMPVNKFGYPRRLTMRNNPALQGHITSVGTIHRDSPLRSRYGDLRLFTKRQWMYLTQQGTGSSFLNVEDKT